ncbi:MAG: 2-hydroxyacyl-CoA dehydratase family protein [Candidatus Methanoperedens sp.]|nr:2-hydroxyacyl-CoA dehydratase family protein [Candidatus Methanoperedens sp.]MCZ7406700.1 2-hydroxyacyl-CoA dehydratase family protein [Candidatus Methanoperedens sp.]
MSESGELFKYPEELEPVFTETDGLEFRDGQQVSAAEIWKFMTKEAPTRFPYAFNKSTHFIGRISSDVNFLSGIKRSYLSLTMRDRLLDAHKKGIPVVLVQGGQTVEPYYAAGGIPLRPGFVMNWARTMVEGLNLRESDLRGMSILEEGRKAVTIEACNQIAAHAAVQESIVPVDFVAPYLCLRCSDMAYLVESHRHGKRKVPTYLVDYPVDHHPSAWRKKYLKEELETLTGKIGKLSNKKVTDEELRAEIKRENKARKLVQDCYKIWWSAKVPPTNSVDHSSIVPFGVDGCGDYSASTKVLEETRNELKERVKHGIKGDGLKDNPVRLYICGSCVGPNPVLVDRAGGVVVGKDDFWSEASTDVKETGDPYENLAEAILSFPYELSTEDRAEWTAEQVKKSRADGLIFMFNWGCNYQTAVARMMSDIIKEKTGVPTTYIEVGELGRMEALEQSHNRVEAFIEMLN